YKAVRQVKSLKEPVMPNKDFPNRIAQTLKKKKKVLRKKKRRIWIGGAASIAAILLIAIMMNFVNPVKYPNVVYAMEQAYNDIKAYNGTLEVVLNNKAGVEKIQSKLDIWVDKNDNYYIEILEGSNKGLKTISDGKRVWQRSGDES